MNEPKNGSIEENLRIKTIVKKREPKFGCQTAVLVQNQQNKHINTSAPACQLTFF